MDWYKKLRLAYSRYDDPSYKPPGWMNLLLPRFQMIAFKHKCGTYIDKRGGIGFFNREDKLIKADETLLRRIWVAKDFGAFDFYVESVCDELNG